ncbi:MAG: transketolase C-terminal domain-containing protein [Gluconacetobacter sp.]
MDNTALYISGFHQTFLPPTAEEAFDALKAPIRRVIPPHTPVPFASVLEALYLPDAAKIEAAVKAVMNHKVTEAA